MASPELSPNAPPTNETIFDSPQLIFDQALALEGLQNQEGTLAVAEFLKLINKECRDLIKEANDWQRQSSDGTSRSKTLQGRGGTRTILTGQYNALGSLWKLRLEQVAKSTIQYDVNEAQGQVPAFVSIDLHSDDGKNEKTLDITLQHDRISIDLLLFLPIEAKQ